MDYFNCLAEIKKIEKTQMKINCLRNAISSSICPIEKQWLQNRLFEQIDIMLCLTNELSKSIKIDNEDKMGRQGMELNLSELASFNGMNGKPAYVAVNGVIYDVSNEATWGGASHFGLMAGRDVTAQFNSCHGMITVLSKLPKVGILK